MTIPTPREAAKTIAAEVLSQFMLECLVAGKEPNDAPEVLNSVVQQQCEAAILADRRALLEADEETMEAMRCALWTYRVQYVVGGYFNPGARWDIHKGAEVISSFQNPGGADIECSRLNMIAALSAFRQARGVQS